MGTNVYGKIVAWCKKLEINMVKLYAFVCLENYSLNLHDSFLKLLGKVGIQTEDEFKNIFCPKFESFLKKSGLYEKVLERYGVTSRSEDVQMNESRADALLQELSISLPVYINGNVVNVVLQLTRDGIKITGDVCSKIQVCGDPDDLVFGTMNVHVLRGGRWTSLLYAQDVVLTRVVFKRDCRPYRVGMSACVPEPLADALIKIKAAELVSLNLSADVQTTR